MTLYGGTLRVVAGAGTVHTWNADVSTKGIKCQGDIYIGGVTLDISSTDDALHSDACVSVTDGALTARADGRVICTLAPMPAEETAGK